MYIDMLGQKRYKINLHTHTRRSDGRVSAWVAARTYREAGYDAIAITDHWKVGLGETLDGLPIIPGCEYNFGLDAGNEGVYHIQSLFHEKDPDVQKTDSLQVCIDKILAAGGIPVLAHPAWSLNNPSDVLTLSGIDFTEIYNTVSGLHMSRRPDSGLIVDVLASKGRIYPLVAADDAHYYDGDECVSYIMVEAEDNTSESLIPAIREGRYYATQGPEIHLSREGDSFVVHCSPCREIVFLSNSVWTPRVFEGEGLTEARYTPTFEECFIRAQVMDQNGKMAWSRIIPIE